MTRCPNCGARQGAVGIAPGGGGPLHYCHACGMLSIVDAQAPEGLRMPTKAERNSAASSPQIQADKVVFLKREKRRMKPNRRNRRILGFTMVEFAVLLAAVLVILALVCLYRVSRVAG